MKEYTPIADFKNHVGEEVTIAGWCYNKRSSKKLYFIIVRDGSAMCQCVAFLPNLSEEIAKICEEINQETSVIVTGKVKKDDRQIGGYELELSNIKIVSQSYDYPISPKEHGVAFLMENRHLWLRSKRQHAILRIRHHITMAIRNFFNERGFINVDAPIFTPNAAEGTTNLFETQYFDQKAYLSQSGQLYMEAAAMSFGKVYCFGPTFRAEKSKTRRHLTEFWMVEPEVAYMELAEDMELAEQFVESVVQHVVNNCEEELKTLERDVEKLRKIKAPFYRMSYDEACEFLAQKKKEYAASDDEEYSREEIAKAADYALRFHVNATFAMAYIDPETIYISARSKGIIDVSKIMKLIGIGGGNEHSAAAKVTGMSIEEVKLKLNSLLIPTTYLDQVSLESKEESQVVACQSKM